MTLNELKVGQSCWVKQIWGNDSLRRRLIDLGMLSGTRVECELESPSKDPKAYRIKEALIAIRNVDARLIEVSLNG